MNSNLSFHDFLPAVNWNQYKMLMSAKGSVYFQILSCYFIDVRLKPLYVKFALNWTNSYKKNKGNSNVHLPQSFFNLKKGQLLQG